MRQPEKLGEATSTEAWEVFRASSGDDREAFRSSYIGHYATRAAFGESLLRDEHDADARLAALPRWLREYVVLDGARFAHDLERDGQFQILSGESGVFVFEGALEPGANGT